MANQSYIESMRQGGKALAIIRDQLIAELKPGQSFAAIEIRAQELILKVGFKPSFSTVPGYSWATCIMKNDELCHGIPSAEKIVETGNIITIDIGLISGGYHLDTTFTAPIEPVSPQASNFLAVGRKTLSKAISEAIAGNTVYDISAALQKGVERAGFNAVYQLTGHGIGKELHMDPSIPVYKQKGDKRKILTVGQTLAIEVMYTSGDAGLVLDADGWTYRTKDGGLAGMFEETVLITENGPEILTKVA